MAKALKKIVRVAGGTDMELSDEQREVLAHLRRLHFALLSTCLVVIATATLPRVDDVEAQLAELAEVARLASRMDSWWLEDPTTHDIPAGTGFEALSPQGKIELQLAPTASPVQLDYEPGDGIEIVGLEPAGLFDSEFGGERFDNRFWTEADNVASELHDQLEIASQGGA